MPTIPAQDISSLHPEPAPPGFKGKVDALQKRYQQIQVELEEFDPAEKLRVSFTQHLEHGKSRVPKISKCICTSLESFSAAQYAEQDGQPNRPMYQLAAFEIMKEALEAVTAKPITTVLIQDPEMNEADMMFVKFRNYRVIDHPQAKEEVDHDVFVYTPCALFEHALEVFSVSWPSVYVGVNLEKWAEHLIANQKYTKAQNKKHREQMTLHRNYFRPYIEITHSKELKIMKDTYISPTFTAYVKRFSGISVAQERERN